MLLALLLSSLPIAIDQEAAFAQDDSLSFFDDYSAPNAPNPSIENENSSPAAVTDAAGVHVPEESSSASSSSNEIVAHPSPPQEASEPKDKLFALREFQVEIAETAYQGEASLANRAALILAHEQQLSQCMPNLFRDLQFSGGQVSAACSAHLEKIRSLDKFNPHLACVKNGIDSQQCQSAFAQQSLGIIEDDSSIPRDSLNARLNEASGAALLNSLRQQLQSVIEKESAGPSEASQREKRDLMKKIIEISCKVVVLSLTPTTENEIHNSTGSSGSADPLKSLVDNVGTAGGSESPGPVAAQNSEQNFDIFSKARPASPGTSANFGGSDIDNKNIFKRRRLISQNCATDIAAALEVYPDFPAAICYRDGLLTPACIKALRKARLEFQKTPGSPTLRPARPNRNPDGLKSF